MPSPYAVDAGTMAGGKWVELEGPLVQIGTTDPAEVQPVLDALRAAGLTIRRVQPVRQTLEDLFMEAVTDPTTGQALTPGAARRPGGGPPGAAAAVRRPAAGGVPGRRSAAIPSRPAGPQGPQGGAR